MITPTIGKMKTKSAQSSLFGTGRVDCRTSTMRKCHLEHSMTFEGRSSSRSTLCIPQGIGARGRGEEDLHHTIISNTNTMKPTTPPPTW